MNILKLRLKHKIRVARIFSEVLAALKGEGYVELQGGIRIPRKLDLKSIGAADVIDNLPKTLGIVEERFELFLAMTTDLDPEKEIPFVEFEDLFAVAEETWGFNGFGKSMEKTMGKVLDAVESAGQSLEENPISRTSSPSSPSMPDTAKSKS